MDPRKQKRLGPAPIASFEKSFEDTTTPHHSGNATVHNAIHQTEMQDINRNSDEMEPHGNITRTTTNTKTITTTTTTTTATVAANITTISREVIQQLQQQQQQLLLQQQQQQQQQPSISVSQTATFGSTKTKVDGNITTTTTTTTATTTTTSTTASTKPRPPPLKATTASGTTTTLVSSGEQQVTFRGATTLTTPSTPRIELSRASSSSHHEEDSRDSSPENVFEQVGTGTLQEAIGLGFREEGALELRSSTEELYFMDPEQKKEEHEKIMQQQQQMQQQHQQQQQQHQQQQQQHQQQPKRSSPLMFKFDDHQSYLQQHQRKDSASSEVAALLCISGRTSRISSVGSQGSAVSRLSAVSGVSRSPSPHRMLLETSFCGPKPLEDLIDGSVNTAVEPATAEILEQVLLARKHDPTQAVLAEGIHVESSPKRTKPTTLSNGDPKINAKIALQNRPAGTTGITSKPIMGRQRQSTKSPGQMIIGKTTSGTEYIRINLKPDHMYDDKGVAPNERVVEAPNTLAPVTSKSSQKKPISLSLGRNAMDETRLTPTASPKPTRHNVLTKDTHGSRSPSPATVNVSRKSSFSSLFRVGGKDSPDSPRERTRSRSKSKDRQTPQSQNATPNKQKSVLAIFKPNKRGSNAGAEAKSSKSSSPIDGQDGPQQQHRSKSNTPLESTTSSRPASRLRYYDEPVEGVIHIPLHTPPEEKETRKLLQGIAQLTAEPVRPIATVTATQLAAAAAALKPVGVRKGSGTGVTIPKPPQIEKLQRIENLDAIHALPQDDDNKNRTWSIEVQRHSSQESQETIGSEGSYASAIRMSARSNLTNVHEHPAQENGIAASAEIHRLPSEDSNTGITELKTVETIAMVSVSAEKCLTEDAVAKERRRLLFATRLGSGSQEQIFSTQFSISKTESQSSQLSEQVQETIPENVAVEQLQRKDTVIRRAEDSFEKTETVAVGKKRPLKRLSSTETAGQRPKSISTSEDEKTSQQTVAAIVLRRKESSEELRRKSRSTSEEDPDSASKNNVANQRHSRYLENFDVRRKYHENVPRKPKRQSISSESNKGETVQLDETPSAETTIRNEPRQPTLPQPPPPSTAPSPSPPLQPQQHPTSATGSRSPTPPTKIGAAHRSQSQSPIEKSKQTPTKPPRTSTPTRRSQTASPPSPSSTASPQMTLKTALQQPDRHSANSTDEPNESSESERDSELAANSATADPKRRHLPRHVGTIEDHESTGLVSQESFDDELPYIPTTLPEERAQGVSLIPMKERANMELKTCPVDRPRSTTPLNPSHLEEYCGIMAATPPEPTFIASGAAPVRGEKLRISLPRKDSAKEKAQNSKSPRRTSNASGKSWFEFAEEGLRATTKDGKDLERKDSNKQLLPQKVNEETISKTAVPSAPATKADKKTPMKTTRKLSGHWIDFENIPEKRKPAKRITALPKDSGTSAASAVQRNHHHTATAPAAHHHSHHGHGHGHAHGHGHGPPDVAASAVNSDGKMHYNYVKPEDCQCECHEVERESSGTTSANPGGASSSASDAAVDANGVSSKALTNVDLLQQGEDMLPLLDPDIQDGIEPSDSSRDYSCYTDDEADVPLRQDGVSRHRVESSSAPKTDEFPRRDGSRSPRSRKFPDHRYS